jgi:site-specific recombinase XerC
MQSIKRIDIAVAASALDLPARPWLLSNFDEARWKFSDQLKGQSASTNCVNWEYDMGHFGVLTDAQHSRWLLTLKLAVWFYRDEPLQSSRSNSSAIVLAQELKRLARWCVEHGVLSLDRFKRADFDVLKKYLKSLGLSQSTIESRLLALVQLWRLRANLPDKLQFDPFPKRGQLKKISRLLGQANGHTPSIKPRPLFELMNAALQWIRRIDDIRDLRDQVLDMRRADGGLSGKDKSILIKDVIRVEMNSWPWLKEIRLPSTSDPREEFASALRQAYGAMIVLLFSFVAFRKHELAYLEVDCVDLSATVTRLAGLVRKTSATPTGTKTDRQIHPIVAEVVEILLSLSNGIRPDGHRDLLLMDPVCIAADRTKVRPVETKNLYWLIDSFVGGTNVELGTRLRPHMLRRAFCLIYAWRFEIGDLITLKEYLYHHSIDMTSAYVEEWEVDDYLPEAEQDLVAELIERRYLGISNQAGGMAGWISRFTAKFAAKFRVLSVEALAAFARASMSRQGITIVASPHGYCFRSPARDVQARCSSGNRTGPDYANRRDTHCAICPNFLAHEGHREHWEAQLTTHQRVLAYVGVPEPLAEAARLGEAACRRILRTIAA